MLLSLHSYNLLYTAATAIQGQLALPSPIQFRLSELVLVLDDAQQGHSEAFDSNPQLVAWAHRIAEESDTFKSSSDRTLILESLGAVIQVSGAHAVRDPKRARLYENRAHVKYNEGSYREAITYFTAAIQHNGGTENSYYSRGVSKMRIGQYHAAIADFDEAIKFGDTESIVFLHRARAYRELGDVKETLLAFEAAIITYPYDIELLIDAGFAKIDFKLFTAAFTDFDRAINQGLQVPQAYLGRGIARASTGDYAGAIVDFSQVLKFDSTRSYNYETPRSSGAFLGPDKATRAEAHQQRGNAHLQSGNHQAANADFSQAVKLRNG